MLLAGAPKRRLLSADILYRAVPARPVTVRRASTDQVLLQELAQIRRHPVQDETRREGVEQDQEDNRKDHHEPFLFGSLFRIGLGACRDI